MLFQSTTTTPNPEIQVVFSSFFASSHNGIFLGEDPGHDNAIS